MGTEYLKLQKYFIGGMEAETLEPMVAGLIKQADEEGKLLELKEICHAVLDELKKKEI